MNEALVTVIENAIADGAREAVFTAADGREINRLQLFGLKIEKPQQLRVWWIPQIPCAPFYVDVVSVAQGVLVMDTLDQYDAFQYDNRIKGDYANAEGMEQLIDGQWETWHDEETGIDDPREYLDQKQ